MQPPFGSYHLGPGAIHAHFDEFDNSLRKPHWVAVNDGVMGGRSGGAPTVADGELQFSGELSLANNGGFSSVRSVGCDFDLSDVSVVVLRVRGDGRYQLRLATDASYRGMSVSYGAGFDTTAGQWMQVRVPLASLEPTVRGSAGPAAGPVAGARDRAADCGQVRRRVWPYG